VRPANSNLVCVSPNFSNTSRCGSGFGVGMYEDDDEGSADCGAPRLRLVLPNVRAKRATTAGCQARAGENVPRTTSPGLVACRWRSA
jgi:hypothetical protein